MSFGRSNRHRTPTTHFCLSISPQSTVQNVFGPADGVEQWPQAGSEGVKSVEVCGSWDGWASRHRLELDASRGGWQRCLPSPPWTRHIPWERFRPKGTAAAYCGRRDCRRREVRSFLPRALIVLPSRLLTSPTMPCPARIPEIWSTVRRAPRQRPDD